jgi:hypothetical protein
MEEGLYYIFEFILKDDIDILINLDQTDWRGYRIRVINYLICLDPKTKEILH